MSSISPTTGEAKQSMNTLKITMGFFRRTALAGYANVGKFNENLTHLGCPVNARRKAAKAAGERKEGEAVNIVRLYAGIFH